MTQFIKVAYEEGIRRLDIVIDAKNLPYYAEKNKNGEIHIIGIQLLENDVYQVQTKDAIKDLEGILYDLDKGYNVYESREDLGNIVSELKKKNDEPKERIFKTYDELVYFLRLNANEDATDEWLVNNSYQLGEWKKLDNGEILHRWESDGGVDHHKSELPVPVNCCNCKKVFKENEHSWCDDGKHICDKCDEIAQDNLAECCHNAELEFSRVGSCFGYNIYACSECGASYDVEIIPDFSTKQKLN